MRRSVARLLSEGEAVVALRPDLLRENLVHDMDENVPTIWTFRGKQWKYRGEGNANLVIAVPQECKVVRFRKSEEPDREGLEREVKERIMLEVQFCQQVMGPLLGDCYVQQLSMAYVEPAERQALATQLHAVRPARRRHKDICGNNVAVCPDCSMLPSHMLVSRRHPTFCVELKPKQGWIAVPDRILPKCTFCLKQHLKLKKGVIKSLSKYCPLDLFSGNHKRMKTALKALLMCPQNNLRIFQGALYQDILCVLEAKKRRSNKDGTLVYGEDKTELLESVLQKWLGNGAHLVNTQRLVENFCQLMVVALTQELCTRKKVPACDGEALGHQSPGHLPPALVGAVAALVSSEPCDWSAGTLPPGCVLARLLEVQKLDQSGLQAVLNARPASAPLYSYVGQLAGPVPLSCMDLVQRYLLAAAARDCSIMVAFQIMPATCASQQVPVVHVIREVAGQEHVFNVQVLDLDPKPLSCIDKKLKRDLDILNVCIDVLGSEPAPASQHNGNDW